MRRAWTNRLWCLTASSRCCGIEQTEPRRSAQRRREERRPTSSAQCVERSLSLLSSFSAAAPSFCPVMSTRRALSPAELACMPLAHAIVEAQTNIAQRQAALLRSQPQQMMAIMKQTNAARKAPDESAADDDDADALDDEKEPIEAKAPAQSRSAAPLAVPATITPEIPSALLALHGQLVSLHGLLQSFPALQRTACFDAVFAGPLFTVMVSHPKAAERAQAAAAGGVGAGSSDSGVLRSAAFPMLPHQDRVWEEMLRCVDSLLQSGIQAPVS